MERVCWTSEQQQLLIFCQCPVFEGAQGLNAHMCSSVQFGGEPVQIVSTAEESHVPFSAPLPLSILTGEKENKHAGLMEKEVLCYKNKQREIESVLLNLT